MTTAIKVSARQITVLLVLVLAAFALSGCGSDNYDAPSATQTETPLIEAATLKSWIDQGLVNSGGYQNVAILDYNGGDEHIPGAVKVGVNELRAVRVEGVAPAASLVPSGEQMDAVLRKLCVNENTTIVITCPSSAMYLATRAYFTFRYWGFPKERIKLLEGGNGAYAALYELSDETVSLAPSSYSVRDLGVLNDGLRASLGDMITLISSGANGDTIQTFDARGGSEASSYAGAAGASKGYIDLNTNKVTFEGHMDGGKALLWKSMWAENSPAGEFKTGEEVRAMLEAAGWEEGMTVYSYCLSGYTATPLFFILDAMTDIPVVVYDGSWSQWGKLSSDPEVGGVLRPGSAWATDVLTYSDPDHTVGPTYNMENGFEVEALTVDPQLDQMYRSATDPRANQVENEDMEYMEGASGSTGAPSATDGDVLLGC
ncbi:selenite/tellurite reduction operon rhodanese-like protein ExtH [uncultured Desulfuromonas sp.]|uniref:selenite/tellurite reduction operon rhodanese-like protein ExtH n=1 Tax=uncultured Desulfuromonas sp. TaxID=181013 RepID=UPI00262A3A6D|nr:selenite/tellurite reduction operon rhodanese-like protein ExtH [uncultured Desulfuromonas sp.]